MHFIYFISSKTIKKQNTQIFPTLQRYNIYREAIMQYEMEQQIISYVPSDMPSNLALIKLIPSPECEILPQRKVYLLAVKQLQIGKDQLARIFIAKSGLQFKPEQLYFWQESTGLPFQKGTLQLLRRKSLIQKRRELSLLFTICGSQAENLYEQDIEYIPNKPQLHNTIRLSLFCPSRDESFTLTLPQAFPSMAWKQRYEVLQKMVRQQLGILKYHNIMISIQLLLDFTKIPINEDSIELIQQSDNLNILLSNQQTINKTSETNSKSINAPQQFTYFILYNTLTPINQKRLSYSKMKGRFIGDILDKQLLFKQNNLDSNNYFIEVRGIPVLANQTIDDFLAIKKQLKNSEKQVLIICVHVYEYSLYFQFVNNKLKKRSVFIWDYFKKQQYKLSCQKINDALPQSLQKSNYMDLQSIVSLANNFQISLDGEKYKINKAFSKEYYQKKPGFNQEWFTYFLELMSALSQMPRSSTPVYSSSEIYLDLNISDCLRFDFPKFWSKSKKKETKTVLQIISSQATVDFTPYLLKPAQQSIVTLPYTTFQVVGVAASKQTTTYTLKARITPAPNRFTQKQMYILWVTKWRDQGFKQSQKHLAPIRTTTVVIFASTKQLSEWLAAHSQSIKSNKFDLALITNMKRTENHTENQQAGCEAIELFRRQCPISHMLLYIGDMGRAKQSLKKRGLDSPLLQCKCLQDDLHQFFKKIYEQNLSYEHPIGYGI